MSETWPEIKERKRKEKLGDTYDWMQSLVSALLICVILFTFFIRIVNVKGTSMLDTLQNGDCLLVTDLFYRPKQGDIVVLRKEEFGKDPIVKRVIATEGQEVNIDFEAGVVFVDGVALEEDYTFTPTNKRIDFNKAVTVPDGCVFVLGDNRNGSTDSRDDRIGFVDERLIIGRAFFLLFPGLSRNAEGRGFGRIGVIHGWAK